MNRRNFFQTLGLAAGAATLPNVLTTKNFHPEKELLKPARLRVGMTVGLIAPASPTSPENYPRAVEKLQKLGFKVLKSPNLTASHGYLAGTDQQRIDDIHWAFSTPEVEAIWCIRGGYGCTRLLPYIDFRLIRRNPKPFIGYSDITALHVSIFQKTGLVTFHGPVGNSDFTDFTIEKLWRVMVNPTPRFEISAPGEDDMLGGESFRPEIITGGKAKGRLIGGNLSLLSALVGTKFCPKFKEKIVFIEEVGEEPYRVDRMLTQLLQATDLKKAAGIALGVFKDCEAKKPEISLSRSEMLRDRLGNLGIPVIYGIPFGHIPNQATLPCGVHAVLDADKMVLTLVEYGVI